MKRLNPLNTNRVDELLRELYLEENSVVANESDANFVMRQDYSIQMSTEKEKELLRKLQRKTKGFKGFRFLIALLIAVFMGFSAYYVILQLKTTKSEQMLPIKQERLNNGAITDTISNIETTKPATVLIKLTDTFCRPKSNIATIYIDSSTRANKETGIPVFRATHQALPFITNSDKILYTKIKNQLLENIIKLNKELYTHLPANKITYANKDLIVPAFNLRNISVTNLEYKAFLADLIIQNKTDDYILAQSYTENWVAINCNTLANMYFQDERYNAFPVVNITANGAKFFCTWLEEETQQYIIQHHLKRMTLQIRLPYAEEWIYAAREGYAKIPFEKEYNTIYDETEGLVDKSFKNRAELIKKRVKKIDTLYTSFTTNKYGWNENELMDFFNKGIAYFANNPNDTINADRMKVLNKIGRASEIIYQKNNGRIWLSGLSWKNKETYQKLENEFKANASSPFVSFRFVVINPNDPEYKNPFW